MSAAEPELTDVEAHGLAALAVIAHWGGAVASAHGGIGVREFAARRVAEIDALLAERTAAPLTERDGETANPAEQLAAEFHAAYEQLAPDYGYVTRPESAVPWPNVLEPNRSLMIHVARLVLMGPTLAAERARVLAPIQAVADEWDTLDDARLGINRIAKATAARTLRAAIEEAGR